MIQIIPQLKIFLARQPVDFRNGIDGLARVCRTVLKKDPFSGCMFLFINKRRTAMKILVYDGQGFWLCQKRLSSGRIRWWPTSGDSSVCNLAACQLQVLIYNGNPQETSFSPEWRKVLPMV